MSKPINIGLVGVGRWGRNYLRVFNELDNVNVISICATKESTLKNILSEIKSSTIKATTDYKEILQDKSVDAVAIVTPSSTHYPLAKEALESGKHAIVEKNLALNYEDAEELANISKRQNKLLMVSCIHRFNPGIQKLKEDIKSGIFGDIHYFHSLHCGNGPVRTDVNALWDFFPHTVSILSLLIGKMPLRVSAIGAAYLKKENEDVAAMNLIFSNGTFSSSFASWLYPTKKMKIVVVGENLFGEFDDYSEVKLKYYNKAEDSANSVKIGNEKPLTEQLEYFLDCIRENSIENNLEEDLKVTKVLEIAQQSMKSGGKTLVIK